MEGGAALNTEEKTEWVLSTNYEILKKIGSGGDGTVYLARHLPTEQLRAAKALKPTVQKDRLHELNMMKSLKHPSLPQILDVVEAQGQLWLIMEYIHGKCLLGADCEQMTAEQFFAVARQLAEVLAYLHTRPVPVLHLDIKPSNVLIRQNGPPVLIDFGAAIWSAPGEKACFGTPGFAAPEQLARAEQPAKEVGLDSRADVYGFGALLYYYLYGHPPQACHLGERFKEKRAFWKRYTDRLLSGCLQKEPDKRYADGRALCRAVCRAERRYDRGRQVRMLGRAVGLLAVVVLFAAGSLLREGTRLGTDGSTQEEYERLLGMAKGLGFEQAAVCYEEAAGLCPDDGGWCIDLLDRIEADYLFTAEEEAIVKRLIFAVVPGRSQTVEEILGKDPGTYGEFAYRLGLLYWYFYEGAGGKSAAAQWFEAAVQSQEDGGTSDWMEAARIHADIGKYYERLGKTDLNGQSQADELDYWRDLKRLWELDALKEENAGVGRQVAQELLSYLIMRTYDLYRAGETKEELLCILESVEQREAAWREAETENGVSNGEGKEQREAAWPDRQQCEAARAAVERVFAERVYGERTITGEGGSGNGEDWETAGEETNHGK